MHARWYLSQSSSEPYYKLGLLLTPLRWSSSGTRSMIRACRLWLTTRQEGNYPSILTRKLTHHLYQITPQYEPAYLITNHRASFLRIHLIIRRVRPYGWFIYCNSSLITPTQTSITMPAHPSVLGTKTVLVLGLAYGGSCSSSIYHPNLFYNARNWHSVFNASRPSRSPCPRSRTSRRVEASCHRS